MVTAERSPVLILTHEPYVIFSSSVQLRSRSNRAAWWAPGGQLRSTHHMDTACKLLYVKAKSGESHGKSVKSPRLVSK